MQQFAVIGQPIHHSLSPLIHRHFAERCAIALDYRRIEMNALQAADWIARFFAAGGNGLNVTVPLKEIAFALADVCTPRAQQAKAANTLWSAEGKIHADNTDGPGLITDLQRYLPLAGTRVLLLGAGGAARGIAGSLLEAGSNELVVSNRHPARAQQLQQDFPAIRLIPWESLGGRFEVLINATSASLQADRLPLSAAAFQGRPFVYDLAYSRHQTTAFLQQCRELGWQGVDGLGMLVEQAAASFHIWHGQYPETTDVLEMLRSVKTR
ncbi:MAG: shikimate dehydrogenase [Legionellaceae bacterium]|nr:shikimate dehydrogenase [Legionellaceae bacterium]